MGGTSVTLATADGLVVLGAVPSIDSFSYVQSALVTPPHHSFELIRHAVFGWDVGADLVIVLAPLLFAALMAAMSVRLLRERLID
jgi:hypothetical protein